VKVVEEMLYLFQYHRIRVILQDDDFPLCGPAARRWADELVARRKALVVPRNQRLGFYYA